MLGVEKACRQAPTAQSATMSPRREVGGSGVEGGDVKVKRRRGEAKRLKWVERAKKRGRK
jgi:hypothetical protein